MTFVVSLDDLTDEQRDQLLLFANSRELARRSTLERLSATLPALDAEQLKAEVQQYLNANRKITQASDAEEAKILVSLRSPDQTIN